ncbi:uncharacterized protein LOC135925890 [Gordionus sp. m RMFG-2023]|uniref:uncharacterized protein LOC135925890 n=1 Tax=Gordionus sp. m RMFG-2023 TaxID=3053472 RepID=UPI0031FE3CED
MRIGIIPIDTDIDRIEYSKTYIELMYEVIISRSLSSLDALPPQELSKINGTDDKGNFVKTSGFIKDLNTYYCSGKFPKELFEAWDIYKGKHGAITCQNQRPNIYPEEQIYLVYEQEYGGQAFERYRFASKYEILSFLYQLSVALCRKEIIYNFEHRDLHMGNVLIKKVPHDTTILYEGSGKLENITILSFGIQISIIDFSFSRMTIGKNYF